MPASLQRSRGTLLILLLVALLLAGCGSHTFAGTLYDPIIPAPEIGGTNWDGTPFSLGDLRGRVILIFFGYTSCPDVCPTALAEMKSITSRLEDRSGEVAVVFVSVDPERDTPERIGVYINAFSPDFYGVYLPTQALPAVKQAYGVFAEKRVVEGSAAGYLIDHTGWTYVVDKQGNLREVFAPDVAVDARLEDVEALLSGS